MDVIFIVLLWALSSVLYDDCMQQQQQHVTFLRAGK
jgi:nitrogen fixation-related uncharacterized protein